MTEEQVSAELAEVRIEELRQAQDSNNTRSVLLVAGFLVSVLAVTLLAISFFAAATLK